jgi:hypothetical protein
MKTVIIYHYFEKNGTYRDNLTFFIANGIHKDADYFIIISGECSISLPVIQNVKYILTKNWNNDFGGYIKYVKDFFSSSYDYYIFINSSVRGPFLPNYIDENWSNFFTKNLKDDIHLVGASINIIPRKSRELDVYYDHFGYLPSFAHVQTTAYALTRKAMIYLIDFGFYDVESQLSKKDVISVYELGLSSQIIRNGWNISAIIPLYDNIDYRINLYKNENNYFNRGDPLFADAFLGRTLSPLDIIFVKINRNMISDVSLASYTFTSMINHRSCALEYENSKLLLKKCYETIDLYQNKKLTKESFLLRIFKRIKKKINKEKH